MGHPAGELTAASAMAIEQLLAKGYARRNDRLLIGIQELVLVRLVSFRDADEANFGRAEERSQLVKVSLRATVQVIAGSNLDVSKLIVVALQAIDPHSEKGPRG